MEVSPRPGRAPLAQLGSERAGQANERLSLKLVLLNTCLPWERVEACSHLRLCFPPFLVLSLGFTKVKWLSSHGTSCSCCPWPGASRSCAALSRETFLPWFFNHSFENESFLSYAGYFYLFLVF